MNAQILLAQDIAPFARVIQWMAEDLPRLLPLDKWEENVTCLKRKKIFACLGQPDFCLMHWKLWALWDNLHTELNWLPSKNIDKTTELGKELQGCTQGKTVKEHDYKVKFSLTAVWIDWSINDKNYIRPCKGFEGSSGTERSPGLAPRIPGPWLEEPLLPCDRLSLLR